MKVSGFECPTWMSKDPLCQFGLSLVLRVLTLPWPHNFLIKLTFILRNIVDHLRARALLIKHNCCYKRSSWTRTLQPLFLYIFFFGISEIVGFRLMQPEYSPEPLLFLELIFKYFNCDESVRIVIYLLSCNGNEVVHKLKLIDIFQKRKIFNE